MSLKITHPYEVDISKPVVPSQLGQDIISGDAYSHEIVVALKDGDVDVDLSSASASVYVIREYPEPYSGLNVATRAGNTLTALLAPGGFGVEGRAYILATVTISDVTRAVLYKYVTITPGVIGTICDPGDAVPSLDTLLAQIAAMEAATALTNEATANVNAAMDANASPLPVIRYDVDYSYTLAQMAHHAKNAGLKFDTMPTAAVGNLGLIVQYVGTTGVYTKGHVYESISSGEGSPTYSWSEIVYGDPNSVSYSVQTGKTEPEKAQARANIGVADTGWASASETWTYVSVDDPAGVIKVQADVTGKYSAGMRIKLTNGENVIYGIITVVSAYGGVQAGYTHITYLHEIDPADNLAKVLMANSAITDNYYSSAKSPFGFPLDHAKWSVVYSDSGTIREQASATFNTWYELYTGLRPSVPIGMWIPKYSVKAQLNNSVAASTTISVTLSTSSATESSALNTASINGPSLSNGCSQYFEKTMKPLSLASKTTLYLNTKGIQGSGTMTIYNRADDLATIIQFTSAYL